MTDDKFVIRLSAHDALSARFDCTSEEFELIVRIVERADSLTLYGLTLEERRTLVMDLDACHSNGCPLHFKKLLDFDDADFFHDVSGIGRYINRDTGKLTDCFEPRCALEGEAS